MMSVAGARVDEGMMDGGELFRVVRDDVVI
jgi:hypothetical protein